MQLSQKHSGTKMEEVEVFPDACKPATEYRVFFDRTVEKIVGKKGITKQSVTREEIDYMTKFIENDLTLKEFEKLVDRFGEKTISVNCFNGSMGELCVYREALKSIENDLEYSKTHEPMTLRNSDDGKVAQDPKQGDHAPAHATHFNNGLGDNAGWVVRSKKGYVWELSAQGIIQTIDEFKAQRMIFELYHKIIPLQDAMEYAEEINKAVQQYLADALQGEIGDSKTAKQAISIITKEGTKNSWSYERTNSLGLEVRQTCEKFDNEVGKLIGHAKIIQKHDDAVDQKLARTVTNLATSMNVDAGNFIALLSKAFGIK